MLWALALLPYFSFLRLELVLTDELLSAQYFISYLILLFAWVLSGPLTAAVLSFLVSAISIYLFLITKEPTFLFQLVLYAVFYVVMVFYLLDIQRKNNDKQITGEKLIEDARRVQDETVKKGQLKAALEKKVERFLGLRRFSEELKEIKDIEGVARRIVKEVYGTLGKAEECVLYLVNESQQQLSLVASQSSAGSVVKEKEGSLFDRWVMKKSQGLLVNDLQNDFRFPREKKTDGKSMRSVCAGPLMTGNKVLGVLRVSAPDAGAFSTDDLHLLDIFSNLGSVTLKNMLLYSKMQEMATHDGLTGLYLSRFFLARLSEERRRADETRKPFALIIADVDHFKRTNDEYGHSAGDIVLKNIASVITKCIDTSDLAARYGGEEFLILLPNRNKKEAMRVAEKLRAAIETNKFMFRRVEERVTASLGVASYPEDARTDEELIRIADRYLYESKRLGRNRVCGST